MGNSITFLNLKNGNNLNFVTLDAKNNPNLACIEVDDIAYSNANWSSYKDATASFSEDCTPSCIVNIPDPNFKNALLTHSPTIDTNGDGEIQCTEAQVFTSNLNLYSKNISDLTGIEAFTNITYMSCDYNQLTGSLDFSSNTSLTNLYCGNNQLTSINVSNNTNLIYFEVHENNLTSIDVSNSPNLEWLNVEKNQLTGLNVDNNTALKTLYAQDNDIVNLNLSNNTLLQSLMVNKNQLTTLNLSSNTGLEYLRCEENELTSLNVSNLPNLDVVYCNANQITNLNVDNSMALRILRCQNNQISSLYLINNWGLEQLYCDFNELTSSGLSLPTYVNTPLKLLSCSNNMLTSLDLNIFSSFLTLDCSDNNLTELRIKNGNNLNITNGNFWANNNPNLICIEVDNLAYSNTNWTNIDSQSCFSENCVTPTFTEVGTICYGDTFSLDDDSQNGISGVWSPAIDNTQTQTYIFTPNICANKTTMTVVVNDIIPTPTGDESQTFTAGQTIADLVVDGTDLVFYNSTYTETFSLTDELVDSQTYYVVSEVGNCMSDPLIITVTMVVSRSEFDIYGFSYHPNPVNDVLYFSSNSKIEKVTISNILGQQVNANLNSDNTILDVSNLPSGNYFVKVTIEGVSKTIKVIKN